MRIGVLGGTFDPVHIGHLLLAEGAREELHLDRVLWIPTHLPPHKEFPHGTAAEDRCQMVALAIEGNPQFELSRIELERPTPSYTIETIRQLRSEWEEKKATLFFLIGSDLGRELPTWRQIDQLRSLVQFVAIPRPGCVGGSLPYEIEEIPVKTIDISSSEIRRRLAQGRSIRYLVPEKVWDYIREKGLYL